MGQCVKEERKRKEKWSDKREDMRLKREEQNYRRDEKKGLGREGNNSDEVLRGKSRSKEIYIGDGQVEKRNKVECENRKGKENTSLNIN